MLFANDQLIDLNTIKLNDGKFYQGQDEIKTLIAGAWKEIEDRFFSKGESVVFKTPGIKSGGGKGNQGYSYPRGVSHKTRKGKINIVWAEDVEERGGKKYYSPVSKRIDVTKKTLTLGQDDIEEILYMFLFNPMVIRPGKLSGKTYLEDKEADAVKYAESETNAAVISYWLFREESPFFASQPKLATLCLAWGVNPDGKSVNYLKQLLAEAVKKAEKRNEIEFNLKAFNSVCEKIKDGQSTRDVDAMALIQQCIIKRIIRFDDERFAWTLLGLDGKQVIKTILKVPPQQVGVSKALLKAHLVKSPDEYEMLRSAAGNEPVVTKHDRVLLSVALPEPDQITEDFLASDLSWADKKALYKYLGHDPRSANLEQIAPVLSEYFILQKRTVPWEIKPGKE